MNLRDQLDKLKVELRSSLDPMVQRTLGDMIERLRMLQIVEHAPAVGEVLPDFALPDSSGRIVTSDELLRKGPLVLAFFRGPWCPYCRLTLTALEEIRPAVEDLGATLVGVSPVKPEELARAAAEHGLRFTLLSDPGEAYAKVCGLHFELTSEQIELYRRLFRELSGQELDLSRLHARAGWELPVPAAYVVGSDGVIAYGYADPDWACRADPGVLVGALRSLSRTAEGGSGG
jgi:peroxiredoxin